MQPKMNTLLFERLRSLFACFSDQKRPFCRTFHLDQNQRGNCCFPVQSLPVFSPMRRYENKWNFHQLKSTKSKR